MTTTLTSSLTIHPAAAMIHMPAEDHADSLAMVRSVSELGILTALKVCKGRIVDGRLRQRGALGAGLAAVPFEEVPEEDVASIIVHSLLARRHYTKSALAYLGYPIMENALAESRRRRVANLQIGVNPSNPRSSISWTIGNSGDLAEQLGVSRALFLMAAAIRKKFGAAPALRIEWEPKILSGEMALGAVQQAISGKIAANEGKTVPKGDANQLMLDLFSTAKVRLDRWEKLAPKQRDAAKEKFVTDFLANLPEELLDAAEEYLESRRVKA